VHLLDVNVLLALLDEDHIHNAVVDDWFDTPGLEWSLCPFTEAGVLRLLTRPKTGNLSIEDVTDMLDGLRQQPGYHYQPIAFDWPTLSRPFIQRLHGHNQVTDAYLLGLAIREDLILVTMDKAILHLAGSEHRKHVLLLGK
jgi:toxin-antitoxin system PIN domain toxin